MTVGVLSFQGDFAEHMDVLASMEVQAMEVRSLGDLKKVDALIIPGGESTVMAKFLEEEKMSREIAARVKQGMPILGTCAGAILLARKVMGKNSPKTLGLIDITVERNAYGTQHESFEALIKLKGKNIPVSFIRAPKITSTGKNVEVLARFRGVPVLVRQGNVIAATFHTEVQNATALHKLLHQLRHIL
ncbi:MAG: pyridoxal 5'-phosphate synthase glutaminase subunit PdxT [Candidatus Peribacteraceae bacterium]